jgi:hypothetical protein
MAKPEQNDLGRATSEQALPGAVANSAEPADARTGRSRSVSSAIEVGQPFPPVFTSEGVYLAAMATPSGGPGAAEASAAATPPVVAEFTQRIRACVVELKRLQTDALSVVLRPDAQTEVQLDLTLRGDGVEVAARLQRGDGDRLAAPWAQLQQALAGQGIRLGALQESPSAAPGDGRGPPGEGGARQAHEDHAGRRDAHERPAPRPDFESVTVQPKPPTPQRAAVAGRGWERWA